MFMFLVAPSSVVSASAGAASPVTVIAGGEIRYIILHLLQSL